MKRLELQWLMGNLFGLLMAVGISACAGTDYIDDPIAPVLMEDTTVVAVRSGDLVPGPIRADTAFGTVRLEQIGMRLRLVLDDDFRSAAGPGLEVFIAHADPPTPGGLSLGRLRQTSGKHYYDIPAGIAIDDYDWVVLYCVPFRVTFGVAMLE